MCKDVDIKTELMQFQVKNDLHEDAELQSELQHALDVLIDKHENVEMPSQSDVKSVVAYVEVGRVDWMAIQLYLKIDWTRIEVGILYMKLELLATTNHNIMLNFGCDWGVYFLTHLKLESSKNMVDQNN